MLALIYRLDALVQACMQAISDLRYHVGAAGTTSNALIAQLRADVNALRIDVDALIDTVGELQVEIDTTNATVAALDLSALHYIASVQTMVSLSPGNIALTYLTNNQNISTYQVWQWSFGSTTPDNGVTILANNANTGRFVLLTAL